MLFFAFFASLSAVLAQLSASSFSLTVDLTNQLYLSPYSVTNSTSGSISFLCIQFSASFMIALTSENVLQIFNRSSPNWIIQNYTTYSDIIAYPYTFYSVSVNQEESLLVLTSFTGSLLQHLTLSLSYSGIISYHNTTGDRSFSTQPHTTFISDQTVFCFYQSTKNNVNDDIYLTNVVDNSSWTVTLTDSGCQISITPDKSRALLWNKNSRVYVHVINSTFDLLYTFTDSQTNYASQGSRVQFSRDSQLALIQSGIQSPIFILNLTDHSSTSIDLHINVNSMTFLDSNNRFLLIQSKNMGNLVFDLQASTTNYMTMSGTFNGDYLMGDPGTGIVYGVSSTGLTIYGTTIVENGATLSYFSLIPLTSSNSTNLTDTNSTSTPTNQTNSTSTQQLLYIDVIYSEEQTVIVNNLNKGLAVVNSIVQNTFSVVFSTPVTVFFLSTFNYFTLSSLYILLNIKLPYAVFSYISVLLNSAKINALDQLNIAPSITPISVQKMDDARALYLGVSSDLISENAVDWIILMSNMILLETVIFLTSQRCIGIRKINQMLVKERKEIYCGLYASNMTFLLLPWRHNLRGGVLNFSSKINILLQYFFLIVIPFMLISSFLRHYNTAKGNRITNTKRVAFRRWWVNYENFIFPFFIFFDSPYYFLVIIGLSHVIFLYNSLYIVKFKILTAMKSAYLIIFHVCFIVFKESNDNHILAFTSIICLFVFMLGALHNLLESLFRVVYFIIKMIKRHCQKSNRVEPKSMKTTRRNKTKFTTRKITTKKGSQNIQKNSNPKLAPIPSLNDKITEEVIFQKRFTMSEQEQASEELQLEDQEQSNSSMECDSIAKTNSQKSVSLSIGKNTEQNLRTQKQIPLIPTKIEANLRIKKDKSLFKFDSIVVERNNEGLSQREKYLAAKFTDIRQQQPEEDIRSSRSSPHFIDIVQKDPNKDSKLYIDTRVRSKKQLTVIPGSPASDSKTECKALTPQPNMTLKQRGRRVKKGKKSIGLEVRERRNRQRVVFADQ